MLSGPEFAEARESHPDDTATVIQQASAMSLGVGQEICHRRAITGRYPEASGYDQEYRGYPEFGAQYGDELCKRE